MDDIKRRTFLSLTGYLLLAGRRSRQCAADDKQLELNQKPSPMPQLTTPENVELKLPLLNQLYRLDAQIRDDTVLPGDQGLGSVGLILQTELKTERYECSPKNALTFALTGGDGDHYSLLIQNGVIDDKSPVILTHPPEEMNYVVGESLFDFLSYGIHGGYFALGWTNGEEPPEDENGLWFYEFVEEEERKILTRLAKELKLKPWPAQSRGSRYAALQKKYRGLVDAPEND